jgi:hypothetical protein
MRRLVFTLLIAGSCPAMAADQPDKQLVASRALAGQLGFELKTALTAALQDSPESAIAVCNERAPQITAQITPDSDTTVGRTSARIRNPKNVATDWQRAVLNDFQNRVRAGESPFNLEYFATVTNSGVTEQRYMKAIPVEPLCLTCHGSALSLSLQQAIKAKYWNDKAVGYKVGDLRGAVYVVRRTPVAR